ncbi:MAG: SGNH/GDSL hydrolase family protein [Solirubrobacteraceae bacterium]|nr:SGNH/GDSL hydrolase family protein [Solirubrobacteraceae bacterium]
MRIRVLRAVLGCLALAVAGLIGLLAIQALIATSDVPDVGYTPPSPAPRTFGAAGTGPALRYVVIGDSTATGEGAPYERSIAVASARHLAARRPVTLRNLAVSGARFGDVRRDQLPAAARAAPDVVLVAAGANDVTGLTGVGSVRADLREIADRLRAARCDVAIVVTGSPDIGAVPRLAQPLRAAAGSRTGRLNRAIANVARERGLVLAPIAERTGRLFRADRSLFAADEFHPSAAGYATWAPVIADALDDALRRAEMRSGCR